MNYTSVFTFLIVGLLTIGGISAQDAGDNFYKGDVLHVIELQFEQPDYWQQMEENFESNFGGNEHIYILGAVTIDGEFVDSVGVRFKGFTSYPFDSNKKPFKIDFNEYVPGQRYDGLRKMNLNNGTGDPAFQRDVLCYKMMRDMGVKAPRTSWARLHVNGEYWGLYQAIEQVDKEFLQNNFADAEGNLYKNKGWSFLEWRGNQKEDYSSIFNLKTNTDIDDWSGFVALMNVINNTSDQDFVDQIENHFNVELFLRTLSVDIATNNWDSFMEHGRNWYMYEDTSGVFHWIPWDYNFALGGTFGFGGGGDCFFFPSFAFSTNGTEEVEFLYTGFSSPDCESLTYEWDFGDGSTSNEESPSHTFPSPGVYNVCLTASAGFQEVTECRSVDASFNPGECATILDGSAGHPADIVFQEILNFIPSCCDFWSGTCEEEWQNANSFLNGGSANDFAIDQSENERILIQRLLAIPEYREQYENYFCTITNDLLLEDRLFDLMDDNRDLIDASVEEDPNNLFTYDRFLRDIDANNEGEGLKGYLSERINSLNADVTENVNCISSEDLSFQELVINELVASNDSIGGVADPDGGYPDWIEFYNTTNRSLDLSGIFLSDDRDNLRKWEFPSGTAVSEGDYVIVWADNDLMQQGLHASFKLKKEGEGVYLSNGDGSIVDSVYYNIEQQTNIGWARIPNGTGDFEFWTTTHNDNNENGVSSTEDPFAEGDLSIFPNPTTGLVNIESPKGKITSIVLQDASGKTIRQQTSGDSHLLLDLSGSEAGLYILQVHMHDGSTRQERIIKMAR